MYTLKFQMAEARQQRMSMVGLAERRKGSGRPRSPIFWLPVAAVLIAAFSGIAFTQSPPAGSDVRSGAWWEWWARPVERNSWLRLPGINGYLYSVHFADAQRGC